MSNRRMMWIVFGAIAILLAGILLSYWGFSSGGETPGSGTGETLTTVTG